MTGNADLVGFCVGLLVSSADAVTSVDLAERNGHPPRPLRLVEPTAVHPWW